MTTPKPTRTYRSPLRAEKAAETRRAIVSAASEVFSERGYAGATMQQVAEQARVSVESVNKIGTKTDLLIKAFQQTYSGEGGWKSIIEQPVLMEIMAIEDTSKAIRGYAEFIAAANGRSGGIWAAVRTGAKSEEKVAEAITGLIERKREDFLLGYGWYASRGITDERTPPAAFASYLYVLTSQETYDQLVEDWGYSVEGYIDWLCTSILNIGPTTAPLPAPESA